jgi:4-amino-4-deoxy-L-arabinose transferase-like glycosyltransferase
MKKRLHPLYTFLQSRPRFDWIFLGVALAVYIGLALFNIAKGSIWFDEAFSAYIIQFNFWDIARYTATDVHPPFYYWVLKIWASIFGHSELGLRSMSIFFGLVTAVFGYLLVLRKFGRRAALMGVAILALSPLFIRYSQEARMYTLSAAIVFAATYIFTRALETNKRKLWIWYGVLVSLGMWTHYFTALAWIAHWVWRAVIVSKTGARGKAFVKAFFTKNWLIAYGLAVGLFIPWMAAMVIQLSVIQSEGFWIGDVGVDTVGTYFGTLVLFLQSFQITGWLSTAFIFMGAVVAYLAVKTYRRADSDSRRSYALIFALAAVPPVVLYIASMPPLTSSFVERYLLPSAVASALFVGIIFAFGLRGQAVWRHIVVYGVTLILLISGLSTMYYYGNYNKNSRTGIETEAVIREINARSQGDDTPIIAGTPWVFYEGVFYDNDKHPIYFIDADTQYDYGSLDMLKYNDQHKIKDLPEFLKQHPTVWYFTYVDGEIKAPRQGWTKIDEITITNHIDGKTVYKAAKFLTTTAE